MDGKDEPTEVDIIDDEDAAEAQRQDAAFQRMYENEHTWEALQEDEHGMLRLDRTAEQRARRQRALAAAARQGRVRRGMIRYLLLVVDLSSAASAPDLRPSRLSCMLQAARDFVRSYFDQNPLSQMGILVMRGGVCMRLTELSSSPEAQLRRLDAAALSAEGSASLGNALDMGVALLRHIPPYGHREMLIMFAALSTCDPGNIFDSMKAAKAANTRVSVVGIAAEVYVCRRLTQETGGQYGVALHEAHLQELMAAHAPPPALKTGEAGAELVSMGFPQRGPDSGATAVFVGPEGRLQPASYACPRCKARVSELPSECHVCNLTLISSPHLARSYHHLFPVPAYDELTYSQLAQLMQEVQAQQQQQQHHGASMQVDGSLEQGSGIAYMGTQEVPYPLYCFGCIRDLSGFVKPSGPGAKGKSKGAGGSMVLRCPTCRRVFCFECDLYVHESLHNCPGCEAAGIGTCSGGPG